MKAISIACAIIWVCTSILVLPDIATAGEPQLFEFQLVDGALTEERNSIRVTEGDQVELRWSSDRPVELHLHGYDIKLKVQPGTPAAMSFEAYAGGRFPISLHGTGGHDHKPVFYLEVYPR